MRPSTSTPERRRWPWLLALVAVVAALLLLLSRTAPIPAEPRAPERTATVPADGRAASRAGAGPVEPADAPVTAPEAAARPAFTGRILSSRDGRGIAGAEVTFLAPEGASSVRSEADGGFRFVPSRPGPHQLAAVLADGFVPFGPDWGQSPIRLVAPPPAGTPELTVWLDPEVRLRGRVEAAEGGAPISGARVTLRAPGGQSRLLGSEREWTTDAAGEFSGTAPPESLLEAHATGFLPAVERLGSGARTQTVTLRLKAAPADAAAEMPLAGRVVEPSGAPVPEAVVTLGASRQRGRGPGALLPAPVTTDAQGRFRFQAVPSQVGWAQAAAGELLSERVNVEAGDTEVVLTVRPGGVIAGRVLYGDGRPATAFALQLARVRRPEPTRTLSVVDPDGRFEVRGLGSGPWELQALARDSGPSDWVRVELPASPGARVERDLRLRVGRRLSGVVRDATSRAPLAGAHVGLESSPGEDSVLVRTGAFTGPDGRFELEGVPDTPVSITAEAERYNRRIVTLPRGRTEVDVALRPLVTDQAPATDLVGIGAVVSRNDEGIVLGNMVSSGGAALAGLHPGDVVLRIDGQPVTDFGFTEAIARLRGEEGSVVRLDVRRADGTMTVVDVVRRPISF
jgi:hypothetical protein